MSVRKGRSTSKKSKAHRKKSSRVVNATKNIPKVEDMVSEDFRALLKNSEVEKIDGGYKAYPTINRNEHWMLIDNTGFTIRLDMTDVVNPDDSIWDNRKGDLQEKLQVQKRFGRLVNRFENVYGYDVNYSHDSMQGYSYYDIRVPRDKQNLDSLKNLIREWETMDKKLDKKYPYIES